ncbi:putative Peroxidase 48 isoform X2 [Vitis vinifera]|uniref:putative Peroxidase 48 isoform X2 n=1 Tax=Vitis vinifera TaxID=29760 RepID=UPI0008FEBA68|nr:putative Peroxidase 48 isoform X2 [Vitis vinifera]|eukprot:XP_019078425.1 PREDICTED: putative Peroxidase 48 isoform X2 [Vitis vinifera]
MQSSTFRLAFLVVLISVLLSLRDPSKGEPQNHAIHGISPPKLDHQPSLEYDFYRNSCPKAESIVRSSMAQIFAAHSDTPPALLRLLFHDCFIQGCDASILLDDSNESTNRSAEKLAIPNQTLKGFDKVEKIKEELEKACPGVVSCADILVLATRDGIVLAGGPFYPVFTGRRDSNQSYFQEAMDDIPKPDGGHSIGKISCEFIQGRLFNFSGTGQPDPSIASDFLDEMRRNCQDSGNSSNGTASPPMVSRAMSELTLGMTYYQGLSSSVSSGSAFDTHYYQSLLQGRGLLFSDQQLMAEEKTERLVRAYASDDGSTFQIDFARSMMKMSTLSVLTGSQGQVRLNCSKMVSS